MTDRPAWTKVTALLDGEPEDWSRWHELFERHGLAGTVQTDEPPTMSAYLAPGAESGLEPLTRSLLEQGAVAVETVQVLEEDWAESWKQFFKPRRIGQFVVRPTWEETETALGEIEIVLDPGQAFGTGDHPTTRMCLELLRAALATRPDVAVADIGCGSGILGIAAAKLGAASIVGVDTDPPSVEAAQANADRNGVRVSVFEGKGFGPLPETATYGVVVSNIISAALVNLAPEAGARVARGGAWIVSGVIEANWEDVLFAAERAGFRLEDERHEDEWVAATFRR